MQRRSRVSTFCVLFFFFVFFLVAFRSVDALSRKVWVIKSYSQLRYPELRPHICDFKTQPCAQVNDLWGYSFWDMDAEGSREHFIAVVGVANGWDFVDVTVIGNPQSIGFIPGCINNWKSMQMYGKMIYSVNDYTATCNCDVGQKCLEHMIVLEPTSVAGPYIMTEGRLTKQLKDTGPVTGRLVPVYPWEDQGCTLLSNAAELVGNVALVPVGSCEIKTKILNVQAAGAISIILVNDADEIIYPALSGDSTNINISGVLIGKTDGLRLKTAHEGGSPVRVSLTHNNLLESPLFGPPEGLTMIDVSDPWNPTLRGHKRDYFQFAHKLLIEQERGLMYVCGMSDRREGQGGIGDNQNGGILVFDVHEDAHPVLVGIWNETYINDIYHRQCGDRHFLIATGIFADDIYILEVTDPTNIKEILQFHVPFMVSHAYLDESCSVMYLTHDKGFEPLTVWVFWNDSNGNVLYNFPPKYLGSLSTSEFGLGSSPHNIYVSENILWAAFFDDGLGVAAWNITDPRAPKLLAHADNRTAGVHSVWGIYPWDDNGYVYATDKDAGLFVMRLETVDEQISDNYIYDNFIIARAIAIFMAVLNFALLGLIGYGGYVVKYYYAPIPRGFS